MKSAGKVMATDFWDARGIIYTDYLGKGQTITGAYYASFLAPVERRNQEKCPHLKKILFQKENAWVHICAVLMAKIMELKSKLLQHSPYSADVAPSDYFSFPNLKNGSADNGSRQTRRSSPKQMPILRNFRNPTLWTA